MKDRLLIVQKEITNTEKGEDRMNPVELGLSDRTHDYMYIYL